MLPLLDNGERKLMSQEANSTHKCTTRLKLKVGLSQLREHLPRSLKPQAFPWAVIHGLHRSGDRFLRHLVQRHGLREVLAQQPIAILV